MCDRPARRSTRATARIGDPPITRDHELPPVAEVWPLGIEIRNRDATKTAALVAESALGQVAGLRSRRSLSYAAGAGSESQRSNASVLSARYDRLGESALEAHRGTVGRLAARRSTRRSFSSHFRRCIWGYLPCGLLRSLPATMRKGMGEAARGRAGQQTPAKRRILRGHRPERALSSSGAEDGPGRPSPCTSASVSLPRWR